jgi:hypothetical protein
MILVLSFPAACRGWQFPLPVLPAVLRVAALIG